MSDKNTEAPLTPTIAIDTIRRFSSTYIERRPSCYSKHRDSLVEDVRKQNELLEIAPSPKPTSYLETLTHYIKANLGTGFFAMGDAFKNGGLILGPILTLFIGIVALHTQHILLKCSRTMKEKLGHFDDPDFAETVQLCFEYGPERTKCLAKYIRFIVNTFICITQAGFCCVYFVFIGSSTKQILDYYGYIMDVNTHMLIILLPVLLPSLITNLKFLAPCSAIANGCMAIGVGVVFYYSFQDIPSPSERVYFADTTKLPLFFGTVLFSFQGIAMVLLLQNSMKKPSQFRSAFGVLNVGMIFVSVLFAVFGFFGYLKWGENVSGSLTLNLPSEDILAQIVNITVAFGMLLTFPLQFFVIIQITWPWFMDKYGPFKRPVFLELLYRTLMVFLIFAVAELVPMLEIFISLIGSLCATALAMMFPPLIELLLAWGSPQGASSGLLIKNVFVLLIGLLGFSTGTYESINALVRELTKSKI